MSQIAMLSGPYPVDDDLGGIGLRLWEIAQVLADAGHHVRLITPRESDFTHPGVSIEPFTEDTWRPIVEGSDAVFTTDLPDTRILLHARRAGKQLIAENAPPIEHLHYPALRHPGQSSALYSDLIARWQLQLLTADHLLVRSEPEHAATLGALVATGRLHSLHQDRGPALSGFLSLVPIGFNRHAKRAAGAGTWTGYSVDLLWNGGIWDYCHPGPLLNALRIARDDGHALSLRFLYTPAPHVQDLIQQQLRWLDLDAQVSWPTSSLPHRERDFLLRAARALVFTSDRPTAENVTCHRLRLRDAGLYRLPVVSDHFGGTGTFIKASGIGAAVDPTDSRALATALINATHNGRPRERYLAALDAHQERFSLETHLVPLLEFLSAGRRAVDAGSTARAQAISDLLRAHPSLVEAAPPVL